MKRKKLVDSIDREVLEHVPELLKGLARLQLEKIDLTTKEKAEASLESISGILSKLDTYRRASKALRVMLDDDTADKKRQEDN